MPASKTGERPGSRP